MGYTAKAALVVGVKWSEICQPCSEDENKYMVFGQIIDYPDPEDNEDIVNPMEIISVNSDYDDAVIGITIGECDYYGTKLQEQSPSLIAGYTNKVQKFLNSMNCSIAPSIYLILQESY